MDYWVMRFLNHRAECFPEVRSRVARSSIDFNKLGFNDAYSDWLFESFPKHDRQLHRSTFDWALYMLAMYELQPSIKLEKGMILSNAYSRKFFSFKHVIAMTIQVQQAVSPGKMNSMVNNFLGAIWADGDMYFHGSWGAGENIIRNGIKLNLGQHKQQDFTHGEGFYVKKFFIRE